MKPKEAASTSKKLHRRKNGEGPAKGKFKIRRKKRSAFVGKNSGKTQRTTG